MTVNSTGYWGEVTATIDWCEHNYTLTKYLAEFWNSVSSLVILVLGLAGALLARRRHLEHRYIWLNFAVAVVGFGSFMFHGTMRFGWQLWDEIPMIYAALVWLFVWLEAPWLTMRRSWLVAIMASYAVLWTTLHAVYGFVVAFQANFGIMQALGMLYTMYAMTQTRSPIVYWLGHMYVWSFFVGIFLWSI